MLIAASSTEARNSTADSLSSALSRGGLAVAILYIMCDSIYFEFVP